MARIFYAEDERDIRESVAAFLRCDGHEVSAFATGDELLDAFTDAECDLVLLDLMMPGTDGLTVLRRLRQTSAVPVIVLTAKKSQVDYFNGLSLGADDYIAKPFSPLVVSAKIHALLRRVQLDTLASADGEEGPTVCGNVCLEAETRSVVVNGETVRLSPLEFQFLGFLMARYGEAVAKDEVLRAVWGIDDGIETRAVEETNRRLRRKLSAAGADVYIQTVWGYGFKLTTLEPGTQDA